MTPLRFLADSTLGKLCKHLRMAGFDCRYDGRLPDGVRLRALSRLEKRLVLTRAQRVAALLREESVVFVHDNDPDAQMRQVIHQLAIRRDALRPLTRCLRCNEELTAIHQNELTGRVPEYVLQHAVQFRICPCCGRVYWPGSHARRMTDVLEQWFEAP